ncbi:MAG: STAS domain-containing protein [Cyanobacteria bacterium P01_H01_bin.15]
MPLEIRPTPNETHTLRLSLAGELTTTTATDLDQFIGQNLAPTTKTLILDLEELHFIASAGLRVLVKSRKLMQSRDGKLLITHPSPQVQKVFKIAKAVPLNEVFQDADELDAYLKKQQSQVENN